MIQYTQINDPDKNIKLCFQEMHPVDVTASIILATGLYRLRYKMYIVTKK